MTGILMSDGRETKEDDYEVKLTSDYRFFPP